MSQIITKGFLSAKIIIKGFFGKIGIAITETISFNGSATTELDFTGSTITELNFNGNVATELSFTGTME